MAQALFAVVVHSGILTFVAAVESVLGIPFFCFFLLPYFLQSYNGLLRLPVLFIWAIGFSAFFSSPVWLALLLMGAASFFYSATNSVLENKTSRLVLAAAVCAGIISMISTVVWTASVISYAIVSIALGTLLTYRSGIFQAKKQSHFLWSADENTT